MYRIFIVEDDSTMAAVMKKQIESWGHSVHVATQFSDILSEFTAYDPHMVLMDVMLPFFNGYHWCSEIRKISNVPVMFISSVSDNMNIVMAMNMGGDDFIAKPVDLTVMGGKIPVLEHQGAVLNLNDAVLTYQGKQLELTKNEFRILQTLLEQKGKIVSRETLMMKLWQVDSYVEENTLTVNVTRLRKKLEQIGLGGWIRTKVGSGYLIE